MLRYKVSRTGLINISGVESFQKLNDSIQNRLKRLAQMKEQGPF